MSKDRDDIAFQKITGRFERRHGHLRELASFEETKMRLLTVYYHQLAKIEGVDFFASGASNSLYHHLSDVMNREFGAIGGLECGDKVVSTEDMVFMISDNISQRVTPSAVLPKFVLSGEVCGVVVGDVPETTDPNELMQLYEDGQPIPMRPFGLSLMLWKAKQELKGKTITRYPSNEAADLTVLVPLDFHAVPMKKLIT